MAKYELPPIKDEHGRLLQFDGLKMDLVAQIANAYTELEALGLKNIQMITEEKDGRTFLKLQGWCSEDPYKRSEHTRKVEVIKEGNHTWTTTKSVESTNTAE